MSSESERQLFQKFGSTPFFDEQLDEYMSKILVIPALAFLVGCAGGAVYDPPSDGDDPTIRFEGDYSLLLYYRNGENCSDAVGIAERYAPWTPNNLPMPVAPDVVSSFQVRQYDVDFQSGRTASVTCGGIYSFTPKRNTDYVFAFRKQAQGCSVTFREKNRADEAGIFSASSIRKRAEKFAMTLKGSACKD